MLKAFLIRSSEIANCFIGTDYEDSFVRNRTCECASMLSVEEKYENVINDLRAIERSVRKSLKLIYFGLGALLHPPFSLIVQLVGIKLVRIVKVKKKIYIYREKISIHIRNMSLACTAVVRI